MNDRELTRHLLTAAVAGLAALSIASTCPHQCATNHRSGSEDCATYTAYGSVPSGSGGPCQGWKSEDYFLWCKCQTNSICQETKVTVQNVAVQKTKQIGQCNATGACSAREQTDGDWETVVVSGPLRNSTGCGESS